MFKVWDKVRCIQEAYGDQKYIEVWEIYTVKIDYNDSCEKSRVDLDEINTSFTRNCFELVTDEREPKQGEMIEWHDNIWNETQYRQTTFVCKYKWKYVCEEKNYENEDILDLVLYDKIRPIKPKDTLQSVFKELQDFVWTYDRTSEFDTEKANMILKRMETFITD